MAEWRTGTNLIYIFNQVCLRLLFHSEIPAGRKLLSVQFPCGSKAFIYGQGQYLPYYFHYSILPKCFGVYLKRADFVLEFWVYFVCHFILKIPHPRLLAIVKQLNRSYFTPKFLIGNLTIVTSYQILGNSVKTLFSYTQVLAID